jgi:hypothetical protein
VSRAEGQVLDKGGEHELFVNGPTRPAHRLLEVQIPERGHRTAREPIDALREESEQFRAWWPRNIVEQALTGQIAIRRPPVGVIRLDVTELTVASHSSLTLCVQVPAQPSDREKLARII